jgi:hypothetical protein
LINYIKTIQHDFLLKRLKLEVITVFSSCCEVFCYNMRLRQCCGNVKAKCNIATFLLGLSALEKEKRTAKLGI